MIGYVESVHERISPPDSLSPLKTSIYANGLLMCSWNRCSTPASYQAFYVYAESLALHGELLA